MTGDRLQELYGVDVDARPAGWLASALALVLRHAGAVFAATLALAGVGGYLASKLPLVTDFAQLIPEDTRSVKDQRAGAPYLGNTSLLVVLIEARGPGREQRAQRAAAALAERLGGDDAFSQVIYRLDTEFFERNGLLYLSVEDLKDLRDRLDERLTKLTLEKTGLYIDLGDDDDDDDNSGDKADGDKADGGQDDIDILDPDVFKERYLSKDSEFTPRKYFRNEAGDAYLVLAQPREAAVDIGYNKSILDRVERHIADLGLRDGDPDLAISLTGNYRSSVEENDAVKRDLRTSGLVSAGLLLIVILIYFRRLRATWTLFVPLLSGVAVMAGYVKVAVGQLNTITGFCFALFMGLSIDFAIHLLARYDEARGQDQSVYDALLATYRETGKAAVAASATSSVAFFALATADFKGFREFGIIAGGGIIICLSVIAIQLPAVIALTERLARAKRFAAFDPEAALARPRRTRDGVVALVCLAIVGLLAYRATHVQWEDDFRNLRGGEPETLNAMSRAQAILGRSTQPAVRIATTLDGARALTQACEDERARRGRESTVQICASLASFLPDDQAAKLPIFAQIKALLTDSRLSAIDDDDLRHQLRAIRDRGATAPITAQDLPADVRASFMSHAGDRYFAMAYPAIQTWLASNNVRFSDELMRADDVIEDDIGPIGTAMIMGDLIRVMERDSVIVVSVALGAVFVVLLLLFRSVTRALAAYIPLITGLVCTLGLMELAGMKLGFFNMIIIPSLIGLGVDNNIYLLHRYHIEGRGSWRYVVNTTGGACMMAAVTTMAGFAGLSLAGHQGLQSIGNLAILGITTATLVSLVMLPAVFGLLERWIPGTAFSLLPRRPFRDA